MHVWGITLLSLFPAPVGSAVSSAGQAGMGSAVSSAGHAGSGHAVRQRRARRQWAVLSAAPGRQVWARCQQRRAHCPLPQAAAQLAPRRAGASPVAVAVAAPCALPVAVGSSPGPGWPRRNFQEDVSQAAELALWGFCCLFQLEKDTAADKKVFGEQDT